MPPVLPKKENGFDKPLENQFKRLPTELIAELFALCSMQPAIILVTSGLIVVDIAQAFVRTYRNIW
jgi:hypothetical protein